MAEALIGYTGFVGGTILTQHKFSDMFNSQNIDQIAGKHYETIVCAGAPGIKWKANQSPEEDKASITKLTDNLTKTLAERFILISTIDVYSNPVDVNESTAIEIPKLSPYGKHRYELEEFVTQMFPSHVIIRLPALFGTGLKKNFIYDLLHNNRLDLTDYRSTFQFYNMANLWQDIQTAIQHKANLINFATEPVQTSDVAQQVFGVSFTNTTENGPVTYDMHTQYANYFGKSGNYLYTKDEIIEQLQHFAWQEKQG